MPKSTRAKTTRKPSLVKSQAGQNTSMTPLLLAVLLFVLAGGFYWYTSSNRQTSSDVNQPEQSAVGETANKPSPQPLFQGKEVYQVSQAQDLQGPRIRSVEMDPHDPKVGEVQKIVVTMSAYPAGIDGVDLTLRTDGKDLTNSLKKTGGDENIEVWSGEWKVTESVLYTYVLEINPLGGDGTTYTQPITMRDSN